MGLKEALMNMRDEIHSNGLNNEDRVIRAEFSDGRYVVLEYGKVDFSDIQAYSCNLSTFSDVFRHYQREYDQRTYNSIPADTFVNLLDKLVMRCTIIQVSY